MGALLVDSNCDIKIKLDTNSSVGISNIKNKFGIINNYTRDL